MKKWSLIITGVLLLITGDLAHSQLLFREGMEFEHYGRNGYNKYARSLINRSSNPRYDDFGNYVMDGVRVFEWTEAKINSKHTNTAEAYSSIYKTNYIDDGEYYRQYLNNLVVVNESLKDFSTRLIVANQMRVKFSPLTVDMAAMNGLRWDINLNDTNLTFISSRADVPLYMSDEYSINEKLKHRLLPVYLTGGHIDRRFGIFNIAANYVNQYRSDSSQSRQQNSITGTLPWYAGMSPAAGGEQVRYMVVQVEDGTRFDGGGPRIYDMYPNINGEKRRDLLVAITHSTWTRDRFDRGKQASVAANNYMNRYYIEPKRIPEYGDYISNPPATQRLLQYVFRRGNNDTNIYSFGDFTDDVKDYLEVNGEEFMQFWFAIPSDSEEIDDVDFWSMIGNDYKISVSEIYTNVYEDQYGLSPSYFQTVAEAPGNIKDMSNLKWVRFKYGRDTANMLLGFKVDSHYKGFDLVAEYNKNLHWRQYYNTEAEKFRRDDEAYYINLKKEFGKFTVGTEYFNIGGNYSTTFESLDSKYANFLEAPTSSWVDQFNADLRILNNPESNSTAFSDPNQYMNSTMLLDTVDDNDDKDMFPDFHMYSFFRDKNGIFPGLDKNGDYRPDTNENDNQLPDYVEPFFLYYVDPDAYDWGDDLNQNGVIDAREDDDRPDYPYDLDTKGYHIFGSYGEQTGLKYTLGFINFDQPLGGGSTDVKYGKVEYYKYIPFYADINFASTLKKAEDTIQDHVFLHQRQLSTTLIDSFTYVDNPFYKREGIQHEVALDQLSYRDSYVSSSYINTKLFRIPNFTVDMKFVYDINHQNKTSYQPENDIIRRSQVFKADYKYYLNKLLIMPQVKFQTLKITDHRAYAHTVHEQYFYPILRVEYPLTFNTSIKAGAQGMPGLNSTVRNLVNSQMNYDQRNYLVMVQTRSLYNGYDFFLNFGYEQYWQDLHGIMYKQYSRTDKILFIKLIVGMEPIS